MKTMQLNLPLQINNQPDKSAMLISSRYIEITSDHSQRNQLVMFNSRFGIQSVNQLDFDQYSQIQRSIGISINPYFSQLNFWPIIQLTISGINPFETKTNVTGGIRR